MVRISNGPYHSKTELMNQKKNNNKKISKVRFSNGVRFSEFGFWAPTVLSLGSSFLHKVVQSYVAVARTYKWG